MKNTIYCIKTYNRMYKMNARIDRAELLEKAKTLGYPLFEIEEKIDANKILADIVGNEDLRLWEGFPVMLANSLDKDLFNVDEALSHLNRNQEREYFLNLVMMSIALYDFLELEFSFADLLYKSNYFDKNRYEEFLNGFKQKKIFVELGIELSSERIVKTFKNYFRRTDLDLKEFAKMQDEFELEFALSQIFPKKQKELFFKKLKSEKFTKTEREYYSRSVRKKVLALSNADLHKLATRLIRE